MELEVQQTKQKPMNSDQSMNRLVGELARWGIILPVDRDERTNQLLCELAAEKEAQMEGAKAILKPLRSFRRPRPAQDFCNREVWL
jgi:hypothetical protein